MWKENLFLSFAFLFRAKVDIFDHLFINYMMRCLLSVGDFSFGKFCSCFPRRGCRGGSCTCTTDLLLWRAVSRNSDFWFSLFVTTAATTFFWLLLWLLCWRLWLGWLCLWLWLTLCCGGCSASGTGTWTSTRTSAQIHNTILLTIIVINLWRKLDGKKSLTSPSRRLACTTFLLPSC